MIKYNDINNDSGINEYEIGDDFILIKFKSLKIYKYSYESAGTDNIENMKKLALIGDGLNSYIMKNCKKLFVK